jgi:hypothetical protein
MIVLNGRHVEGATNLVLSSVRKLLLISAAVFVTACVSRTELLSKQATSGELTVKSAGPIQPSRNLRRTRSINRELSADEMQLLNLLRKIDQLEWVEILSNPILLERELGVYVYGWRAEGDGDVMKRQGCNDPRNIVGVSVGWSRRLPKDGEKRYLRVQHLGNEWCNVQLQVDMVEHVFGEPISRSFTATAHGVYISDFRYRIGVSADIEALVQYTSKPQGVVLSIYLTSWE